jgi:hypothetical protein
MKKILSKAYWLYALNNFKMGGLIVLFPFIVLISLIEVCVIRRYKIIIWYSEKLRILHQKIEDYENL